MKEVFLGCEHDCGHRLGGAGSAGGGFVRPATTTRPEMTLVSCALIGRGWPTSQVTDAPSPFHTLESRLSKAGRPGNQDGGTQNVNPEARTSRQDESTGPTSEIVHLVKTVGTVEGATCEHAAHNATSAACHLIGTRSDAVRMRP